MSASNTQTMTITAFCQWVGITRAWYYLLRKRDPVVVEGLVLEAAAWGRLSPEARHETFRRALEQRGLWTKQGTHKRSK